jgi:hypothetical protein
VELVVPFDEGAGSPGAGAVVPAPPACRALMASTRSDLRIRAVPLMPSWEAIACSSGSRRAVRLPVR